ncbi:ArsR family transcriptional regulator [Streptomyces sp. 150FB]|uniref:ArsR/SmtB family transcription factor n=1 Tax=Streptomyces sp. 150FB TaxID=1576605 RepID=UPI0005893ADF|nr:helix-turn-helix domain-containing protein [Streptomyces sp. 150FB]KIF76695.1 ArsR family transcriptional regulator [Streptomyces sp. 150FB]
MRSLPEPARESLTLAQVLHALGDPVRLELLRRARGNPGATCSTLADGMDVPISTLSNHWRILREGGLISMAVDGRHRRIRLRANDLDDRFPDVLDPILRLAAPDLATSDQAAPDLAAPESPNGGPA